MAQLFERDEKTLRKHINNVFSEGEVDRDSNTQKMRVAGVSQPVAFYNLDVIISVGYRVKSQRGVEFRRWANSVLKDYILRGYAVNDRRISQLGQIVQIMKRAENQLDAQQVLSVVESYSTALDMLDDYDHQTLSRPKGNKATYVLSYDECQEVIDKMKFASDSDLFGNEKDDSFKGSIGAIYQSFDWYFCKSGKYFCGTPKEHDTIGYDVIKLHALNTSTDFVSLPDCHRMTDEEAAEVIKNWCIQNDIPYNDDMDNIEETYRRYYKYDKYDYPADIIEEETMIKVYCYSRCSTCRKALKWLDDNGVKYEAIDIKTDHPDESTLRMYYEKSGLPLKRFFNTSGMQYRELGLSKKLPDMSEDEQLALLATDGMLVKRPLVVGDGFILTGFKEEEWADKLK